MFQWLFIPREDAFCYEMKGKYKTRLGRLGGENKHICIYLKEHICFSFLSVLICASHFKSDQYQSS